ncbi:hypothetical protein LCGC14_0378250 [marine sediment metagenome]|uniref:Methyltransferase type 11 domain-containing protein n=1 Tax=marine sediment metagenome TaxID=412755 RepID=A0A0F9VQG0_9ZZZZ
MTSQNPKPWTKEHELAYWNAESDDYYLANIRQKYKLFNVDRVTKDWSGMPDDCMTHLKTAIDIGGGAYGGALYYFGNNSDKAMIKVQHRILIDALTPEFRAMGKVPAYIDSITADFDNIPLKDEVADLLFAWNVFDHATSNEHFILGMFEVKRLLKPGGLFFGSFPLREQPSNGHPVTLTEQLVMRQLTRRKHKQHHEFKILKTFKVHEPTYRDETLFVVAEKH